MRPFDFMVPFWGARHRDQFVDFCLPSLLAPDNLGLLRATDGHRFLIATTAADWGAVRGLPIMKRLAQHAAPILIEVTTPAIAAQMSSYERYHASIVHLHHCIKRLLLESYKRQGYGCQFFPDHVFSGGMVSCLIKSANAGYQMVISPSFRQIEEGILNELMSCGYLGAGKRLSETAECLAIPQRIMADMALRHLHPEMLTFDQERPSPGFPLPLRYWRIKGNRGLLMHTFLTGMLALIDFATLAPNHADCLDLCDIENDYVAKNCTDSSRIHVVQDSDEFILASLTPKSVNWAPPPPVRYYAPGWLTEIERLSNIRESMKFYATANGDQVKRDLFARPIRWHRGDIDDVWTQEERRIERSIKLAVGDYYNLGTVRKNGPSRVRDWLLKSPGAYRAIIHFCVLISIAFSRLSELGRRMWLAMRGDPAARNWVSWRVQVFWRQLQGHKTHPPRPDVP